MRFVTGLLLVAVLGSPLAVYGGDVTNASRMQLEARSRELDREVIEHQHEILAARHDGDAAALARAEAELKRTQEERVDVLRALGQLR